MDDDISRTWNTWITTWSTHMIGARRSKGTLNLRLYYLNRLRADCCRTVTWASDGKIYTALAPHQLTPDLLTAWVARFDWSNETARSCRASLVTFFTWAHNSGRLPTNPAALMPTVSVPLGHPRPTPEEYFQQALREATDRERLMLRLAGNGGLRRGEVARAHTDWLQRAIDGWQLRVIGKGNKVRIVPILDDLARDLLRQPPGYLFPGKIDGHLSAPYVGKLISRLLPKGFATHTLRHRFAGKAYEGERDIRAVQELLGHASVRTTQIYTAVPSGALRNAVRAAA